MSSRKNEDAIPSLLDETIPPISNEQAELTREHARRWATDDAEYELFTTMLLGDDT